MDELAEDSPPNPVADVPEVREALHASAARFLRCSRSLTASLCRMCSLPLRKLRNSRSVSGLLLTMAEGLLPKTSLHLGPPFAKSRRPPSSRPLVAISPGLLQVRPST